MPCNEQIITLWLPRLLLSRLAARNTLECIQSAAARLAFNLWKHSQVTHLLRSCYWLPVSGIIQFQTLSWPIQPQMSYSPATLHSILHQAVHPQPRRFDQTPLVRIAPPSLHTKGPIWNFSILLVFDLGIILSFYNCCCSILFKPI